MKLWIGRPLFAIGDQATQDLIFFGVILGGDLAHSQRIGRKSIVGYLSEFGDKCVYRCPLGSLLIEDVAEYLLDAAASSEE